MLVRTGRSCGSLPVTIQYYVVFPQFLNICTGTKTIAHCFCMFSLSLARQFLVCFGNRQTFKDLSHQIIQTTSLEQDLPQQKSTDNNSQWFPLFPCLCVLMPETPERNVRLTQLHWDGCEGMLWRKRGREVWGDGYLFSQPVEFLIWAVFGTWVSFFSLSLFLIQISFLLLCVCSVMPLSHFWSDILFMVVFRADMCSSRPALLASKSWLVCHDGSFQSLRHWISVPTKQYDDTLYFF